MCPTAAQEAAEAQVRKHLEAAGGTVLSRTQDDQHVQLVVDVPLPECIAQALEDRAMRMMGIRLRAALDSVEPAPAERRLLTPAEFGKPSLLADEVVERVAAAINDKGKPPTTNLALASGGNGEPAKKGRRKQRPPSDARLMTMEDFASSIGFGKRKVEQFVAEGMPTVGDRRSRRVLVKEAQEWVIRRLQDDGSDVVHRAKVDARKRGSK